MNKNGERFVNEAVSYHDFVEGMFDANERAPCFPCYLICDTPFIRKYGLGVVYPGAGNLRRLLNAGYLKRGKGLLAPLAAIEMLRNALDLPIDDALRREWDVFLGLLRSEQAKSQRHIFFAEREAAKIAGIPADTRAREVKRALVSEENFATADAARDAGNDCLKGMSSDH